MSVLHKAIQSGAPNIVNGLLDHCSDAEEKRDVIHHAILFAIQEDDIVMFKHLLQQYDAVRCDVVCLL